MTVSKATVPTTGQLDEWAMTLTATTIAAPSFAVRQTVPTPEKPVHAFRTPRVDLILG